MFRVAQPYCFHKPPFVKGDLSEVNTGQPVMYVKRHMDGSKEARYHVNLIHLLDRVFRHDGMKFLSIEEERFIEMFLKQAGVVTDKLRNNATNAYEGIDDIFLQLDDFLGGYKGEDYGRYAR